MQLTQKQQEIMNANGHLLITGGPGSGKTTASIMKAAKITLRDLRLGQKILFLSFARATISRVVEAIEYEQEILYEQKQRIDVETYHSFFWRILKTHGYLAGLPRRLSILSPTEEAIELSTIRNEYDTNSKLSKKIKTEKTKKENAERHRLAREKGRVCFDLFAPFVFSILHISERIRKLIANMYPVIILDEFQDTNKGQWDVVQELGQYSILLALGDPEQRIYDFLGADPQRLNHFRVKFAPIEVDLTTDNHRSAGTDIVMYGNDVLSGQFRKETYAGVEICHYPPYDNQAFSNLVTTTNKAKQRLIGNNGNDWSLAILVPTKKMTRLVSDAFRCPATGQEEIPHVAAIELEAAILGAEIIAFLMQQCTDERHFDLFIALLRNYFHGKGGTTPTKKDFTEAKNIQKAYEKRSVALADRKTINKNSILVAILAVYEQTRALALTGDPDKDWSAMRNILEKGACVRLKEVAEEARNIRLLERGTQLRRELSQNWRENGSYSNALAIIRQAFIQEHFSTKVNPAAGVVVMNMHKAKGKQFDEVIIFEGWPRSHKGKIVANPDRIVRGNDRTKISSQERQNLRVSVTRSKQRTTILTPKNDPCVLLINAG